MRSAFLIIGAAFAAFLIGAFVFLYSQHSFSNTSATATNTTTQTTAISVPFTQLAQGSQSTVTGRANYLITSTTQLSDLWNMIDAQGETPTIDFNTHDVIAVFAGKEPTAGYTIAVSTVSDSTVRQVLVTLNSPGPSCLLAQSVTEPYQIIVLPKTTLPLTHTDIATTTGCLQ
jgi:hypothetical protein